MHDIWDNEISNKVQVISLLLEIVGLALALFQFYFEEKAVRIERKIMKFANDSYLLKKGRVYKNGIGSLICLLLIWYGIIGEVNLKGLPLILGSIFLIAFLLNSIILLIVLFNKLSKNKSIGGLGLLLAIIGIIGEIYQVLTLHFTEGLPTF